MNVPMTASELGKWFFDLWIALDGDERYVEICSEIEGELQRKYPHEFNVAFELFDKLTDNHNSQFE